MLWLFRNRFVSNPHDEDVVQLDDTPETWAKLLDDPEAVGDDIGKEAASVLCGACYFDDANNRDKEGVDSVTCLVLDVDNDDPITSIGHVPSEFALRTSLEGTRAIVYTSPSHTTLKPRWRVLMPLATPIPPKKHRALVRWLSDNLVAGYAGCIDVDSTGDPCRLGFVAVTKHPDDYLWWSQEGERFDWTRLPLEDEEWIDAPLGGLDRQPQWTDRATALQFALRAYGSRGYEEVKSGEHRTMVLWNAALDLWWAWAAEDEDFVMTVLRHINEQFPETKDESEIYRKMNEAHGRTVGPNRKVQLNGPYGSKREPSNTISEASIRHLAKRLKRSQKPALARVGDEMWRVVNGETVADDHATWRSALGRVATQLASNFSNDKRDRISGFFVKSLTTMIASAGGVETSVPSRAEIEGWIGVKVEGEKKRRAENASRLEDNTRKSIEFATGGRRDTKYKMEEVDAWMAPNGCGLNDKTWLLQCGKGTWVFLDGTWAGPYADSEFDAQGYTDLEAASEFVRTKTFNEEKGTWAFVPLKVLLQKYGSKCDTQVDFACEKSWFRHEDKTLILSGPVRNHIEAKFHPEVDEWIRVMTGRPTPSNEKVRQDEAKNASEVDDYDGVCNWLACLVQLEHICAALYLQGPKSVGKGLFADGIAKIWKGGKIPLTAAAGHFNSLLIERPLIHVDEGLPPKMSASVLLRRTLAEVEHVYTRKHIDSGKISGCVRMLFTANNLDIFNKDGEDDLKRDDVDALEDRFVHIVVRPEAADYLRRLGPKHHDFAKKNMLAEHTIWLNEKRWSTIKVRDLRFLVSGRNANVSNVVATNAPSTSDVCNALAEALSEQRQPDFLAVRNGELWVNAPLVRRYISLQNPFAKYTEREVTRAVSSISAKRNSATIIVKNKKVRMWALRIDALEAWCRNAEVYDWIDVQAGLVKLNEVST